MHKSNKQKELVTIHEIKVYQIKHIQLKTREDWYRPQFLVTFKNSSERLNIKTTKLIWKSGDHKLIRDKVRWQFNW